MFGKSTNSDLKGAAREHVQQSPSLHESSYVVYASVSSESAWRLRALRTDVMSQQVRNDREIWWISLYTARENRFSALSQEH